MEGGTSTLSLITLFIETASVNLNNVRSILSGKHNRVYYKIESNEIVIINIYDTRINLKKNKLSSFTAKSIYIKLVKLLENSLLDSSSKESRYF